MNKRLLTSLRALSTDRRMLTLSVIIVILAVTYVLYVAFSISPTEQQIATRFTAFGETQLYRNKWYYLLSFVVFAVLVAVSHIALMEKLRERNLRSLGLSLGVLTIIIFVLLFFITQSVLGIAYLS